MADGKRAATALTNASLTQLHLPALPLGLLAGVPGLRLAAEAKLRQQQAAALEELGACLQRLREAAAGLGAASDSLRQLLDAEAAAPLLAEAPVFASLPLRLLGGMFAELAAMHDAELAVKAGVLRGFQQITGERAGCGGGTAASQGRIDGCKCSAGRQCCAGRGLGDGQLSPAPDRCCAGDLREADQPAEGSGGGGGGRTGRAAAAREAALRRTMQVYLTAWLLSPEVDERRVEAHLAAVRQEMQGF